MRAIVHLSTLVILTMIASLLLGANLRRGQFGEWHFILKGENLWEPQFRENAYGWPVIVAITSPNIEKKTLNFFGGIQGNAIWVYPGMVIVWAGVLCNLMINALILFFIWFISEWLIRRREARKT